MTAIEGAQEVHMSGELIGALIAIVELALLVVFILMFGNKKTEGTVPTKGQALKHKYAQLFSINAKRKYIYFI